MLRNPRLMQFIAGALIVVGLLEAAVGSVVSGLIVAVCGAVLLLRQRYFPGYRRRQS